MIRRFIGLYVIAVLAVWADVPSQVPLPTAAGWRDAVAGFFLSFFMVVGGNRLLARFRRRR
jgi:hypothetical protein